MIAPVKPQAVAIGASAGAIEALSHILPLLPADYPLPLLVVVHLKPDSNSMLPELFSVKCRIEIKEAEDKEMIRPGVVYFAPPNYHLLVESAGLLSLSSDEPELFSRPAINVLFESAAEAYGPVLVGIILTGASADGAHGLRAVREAGGVALAQNPATAEVRAMPSAALEACPDARMLALDEIAAFLQELAKPAPDSC